MRFVRPDTRACSASSDMTREGRHGWLIVAGLATVCFVVCGTTLSTISIFIDPLTTEFALTAQQASSVATTFILGLQLAGVLVGWSLNRLGARSVMSIAAILAAAGYVWAGASTSLTGLMLAFGLSGIGVGASTLMPSMVVVANWIIAKRAIAIGVVLGASSLGGTIFPPLVARCIGMFGWRHTADGIAVVTVIIALPILLFLIKLPLRAAETPEAPVAGVRPAWRTPAYWLITSIVALGNFSAMGIFFSAVSFLVRRGYSLDMASFIFAATSLTTFAGYLLIGIAADRRRPTSVLLSALIVGGLGILGFLYADHTWLGICAIAMFVILWGLTAGAPPQLAPLLVLEHFGLSRLAPTLGAINLIAGVVSSFGAIVTGRLVDATGDYTAAFALSAIVSIAGVIPLVLLKIASPRTSPSEIGVYEVLR